VEIGGITVLRYRVKTRLQVILPAQCIWLLAANAVQGETIGDLNTPAVLEYRIKTALVAAIFYVDNMEFI